MVLEGEAEEITECVAVLMGSVDVEGWVDDLGRSEVIHGVGQRVVEACPVFGGV